MARSSNSDPVEKFRFNVTFLSLGLAPENVIESVNQAAIAAKMTGYGALRAGFSDVTLPSVDVNQIEYRDNQDAYRSAKIAGLVKYNPITFKRGVTVNRDLYFWLKSVNNEKMIQALASEYTSLFGTKPFNPQDEVYRKDIVIDVISRDGKIVKRWFVFNAFPISYVPGDGLSASSSEKLIEELTVTYEMFVELVVPSVGATVLKDQLGAMAGELARDGVESAISAGIDEFISSDPLKDEF